MAEGAPRRRSAVLAFALLLPGLVFAVGNVLAYNLGVDGLIGPLEAVFLQNVPVIAEIVTVVVVLGPLAAMALSLWSIARVRFRREDGSLVGTVAVTLHAAHLAVAGLAVMVMAALAVYLIVENLGHAY